MTEAAMPAMHRDRVQTAGALFIALCILALDVLSPLQGAVAVLYTTVILVAARTNRRNMVIIAGFVCAVLAFIGYCASHWNEPLGSPAMRLAVSLVAIGITTVLSARHRTARDTLAEQARMLELTHDTVIIRAADDTILYWNEGAEQLYGWTRAEALGRKSRALLATHVEDAAFVQMEQQGLWSGEVSRVRKNGERIVLASRWLTRRDHHRGATGIIETSADLTEQRRAAEARRQSEERYRTIFNTAGLPIWEADWSRAHALMMQERTVDPQVIADVAGAARIRDANMAAAQLFGLDSRGALIGGTIVAYHTPMAEVALGRILAALWQGETEIEEETQFRTLTGEIIDVVLRVTLPPGDAEWRRVLVMAVDVTERSRTQARLVRAQADLTHMARITTLGQLAASIAHEVNQPLSAIITYAKSGRRWLAREAPDAPEVADCLEHIAANGVRAADVIDRVRNLARKADPKQTRIELPQLFEETVALLDRVMQAHQVVLRVSVPDDLAAVAGDRVQIQQVLMNLMLNAEQAMARTAADRRGLHLAAHGEDDRVVVELRDHGTGIAGDPEDIFRPFFSTKADGMGMGLSICRSIIEQHGGTLSAANHPEGGAIFRFHLPTAETGQGAAV